MGSCRKTVMSPIQVLDLAPISLNKSQPLHDDFKKLAADLDTSFADIGFAYIKNHGIGQDIIDNAMEASMKFFKLAHDVKTLSRKGSEYQGWVEQGREIFDQDEDGKVAELEVRETYDLKNISPSGIFPDKNCPELRTALTRLSEESKALTKRLLHCLSLALGKQGDFLNGQHQGMLSEGMEDEVECSTTLRSIHYPPIPDNLAAQPGIIRCGEHSDYGTITLLFQDSLGGLEVKDVTGTWVSANPIPGTILVNVGDLLEAMTAGKYPATRHRVVVPEQEFMRKTLRQSIAFFVHPDDAIVCEPLSGPDPRYPPVTARGHLENRFKATYGARLE